jgi:hypothetical protein
MLISSDRKFRQTKRVRSLGDWFGDWSPVFPDLLTQKLLSFGTLHASVPIEILLVYFSQPEVLVPNPFFEYIIFVEHKVGAESVDCVTGPWIELTVY